MKKNRVISQHNTLTFARYEMGSTEKNIFYVLLSKLRKEDEEDQVYFIDLKEIESLCGETQNYKQIKASAIALARRHIMAENINSKEFQVINLLQTLTYRSGTITIKLTKEIRPYLFHLKDHFTEFTLREALSLSGKYAKRFYEILNSWKDKRKYNVTVSELKRLFNIEKKYKQWGELKKRVIEPSIKEINEKTNLVISWEANKVGRSIHDLDFSIKFKEEKEAPKKKVLTWPGLTDEQKSNFLYLINELADWQKRSIHDHLLAHEMNQVKYYCKIALEDHNKVDEIRNTALFKAEFIQGFCQKYYKKDLELIKNDRSFFKFNWSLYKPNKVRPRHMIT